MIQMFLYDIADVEKKYSPYLCLQYEKMKIGTSLYFIGQYNRTAIKVVICYWAYEIRIICPFLVDSHKFHAFIKPSGVR